MNTGIGMMGVNTGIGMMGMGTLGSKVKCPECDEEFSFCPRIVFKRKFRWTVEGELPGGKLEPLFVKVTARPIIEETEINFLSAKTWIPGKAAGWEAMTITAWELENNAKFWSVIQSAFDENPVECPPEKYSKFIFKLYDGCGCLMESWEISEAYVSKFNFVELDYSSTELTDVEMVIRYKKVVYNNGLEPGKSAEYLPHPLGLGMLGSPQKAKCPKCNHEFVVGPNPNILY